MRFISSLLCSIFLLGSASLFALEKTPVPDQTRVEPQLLDPMVLEGSVDSTYRLGPGDLLQIFVENHNYAVQVGPDGSVTLDEVGPKQVAGLTLGEARELIIAALATKFRREYCFVSLARLKRFMLPVTGAVKNQTTLSVDGVGRVSWAIHAAGGTTFNADDRNVMVLRGDDTLRVDLFALTRFGKIDQDLQLQQGDRIYVPRMSHAQPQVSVGLVDGTVHYLPHVENWSAYDYLEFAEQWEQRGGADHIVITRAGGEAETVAIPEAPDTYLKPGDRVELVTAPLEVFVGGAVVSPGALPYRPGWKVVDYLKAAGVQVVAEDLRRVKVIRADKKIESVSSLEAPVSPGDFIRLDKSTLEYAKDWATIITAIVSMVYTIVLINATMDK